MTTTNDSDDRISAIANGRAYTFGGFNGGYGNVIMIDHGSEIVSLYAHIKDGGFEGTFPRDVVQGEVIAHAGGTGGVPVHLHLELRSGVSSALLQAGDRRALSAGTGIKAEPMSGYSDFGQWGLSVAHGCDNNIPSPRLVSTPPTTPPSGGQLDLVFVIDTTGSMGDDIAAVKAATSKIVDELARGGRDYRVGLVDYKDHPVSGGESSDYPSRVMLQLTASRPSIIDNISALGASGGGDTPESVYSGVISGLKLDWRPSAQRKIILMGDAPPKDPEPVTNYTFLKVVAAALSRGLIVLPNPTLPSEAASAKPVAKVSASDAPAAAIVGEGEAPIFDHPVQIFPVEIGGGGGPLFERLAEETGGTHFNAAQASDVVEAILDAIDIIIGGSAVTPVPFDLSAQAGTSGLNAMGRVVGDKTEGYVVGRLRGQPIPNTTISEAGLTTREGRELLIVRFSANEEPWELRFHPSVETVELCGPDGCETGTGRATIGLVAPLPSSTADDHLVETAPTFTTATSSPATTSVLPISTTSTTMRAELGTSTTSESSTPTTTTTTTVAASASCARMKRQLDRTSDPRVIAQVLLLMQAAGCSD